jgi:hypothetical protein
MNKINIVSIVLATYCLFVISACSKENFNLNDIVGVYDSAIYKNSSVDYGKTMITSINGSYFFQNSSNTFRSDLIPIKSNNSDGFTFDYSVATNLTYKDGIGKRINANTIIVSYKQIFNNEETNYLITGSK